jgi:hypothetical protein
MADSSISIQKASQMIKLASREGSQGYGSWPTLLAAALLVLCVCMVVVTFQDDAAAKMPIFSWPVAELVVQALFIFAFAYRILSQNEDGD